MCSLPSRARFWSWVVVMEVKISFLVRSSIRSPKPLAKRQYICNTTWLCSLRMSFPIYYKATLFLIFFRRGVVILLLLWFFEGVDVDVVFFIYNNMHTRSLSDLSKIPECGIILHATVNIRSIFLKFAFLLHAILGHTHKGHCNP